MPNDGVLIVDGVFALRPELTSHWDLRIWIDIDPVLSIRRGIARDSGREGRARAEALHRERYAPAERLYIAEADPVSHADVVIDNTLYANPDLLLSAAARPPFVGFEVRVLNPSGVPVQG